MIGLNFMFRLLYWRRGWVCLLGGGGGGLGVNSYPWNWGDCEESALNLECVFMSTVGGLFTKINILIIDYCSLKPVGGSTVVFSDLHFLCCSGPKNGSQVRRSKYIYYQFLSNSSSWLVNFLVVMDCIVFLKLLLILVNVRSPISFLYSDPNNSFHKFYCEDPSICILCPVVPWQPVACIAIEGFQNGGHCWSQRP